MKVNAFENISADQFIERIILSKADALVKISSTWNGSALLLCLTLQDLALKYKGKLNFFMVDSDVNPSITTTYMVEALPTLLFFKKGTLVDKLTGLNQKSVINEKINQLVNL